MPTTPTPTPQTATVLPPGHWRLSREKSTLSFKTKAMGFLPVRGTFTEYEGELRTDAEGMATGGLKITAESISTGIRKRDAHLRTADFLNVERHPHLEFQLESLVPAADGTFRLTGTLSARDQRLAIDVAVTVTPSGSALKLDGGFDVDHHAMGLEFKHLPKRVQIEAALVLDSDPS